MDSAEPRAQAADGESRCPILRGCIAKGGGRSMAYRRLPACMGNEPSVQAGCLRYRRRLPVSTPPPTNSRRGWGTPSHATLILILRDTPASLEESN